jgi:trigger factor
MQVSLESTGTLGRRLTVAVSAERVEEEFSTRLARLSRQVKLPGFRPGKVPLTMVERQYGGRLMEEVAGDLIETSLKEAIHREGLRPAAGPRIRRKELARGRELEYTAEFEIYPEIKKLDIQGVAIERPVATVTAEDVERTLETVRRQRVTWNPVARAAQVNDRLLIDFTGRCEGKPFEGGSANNFPLVLGSGTLVGDLEQGLVGARAGEARALPVRFPADYRHAPLAGKTAEFEVKINEVAEPVLPEVNGDFAKRLGVTDGNVETLRAEVKNNLEREAAVRARAVVRGRVLKALVDANDFEVPQGLVEAEVAKLKRLVQATRAAPSLDEAALRARGRTRVMLGLILSEIVRTRGLKPDAGRVRARLEEMASEYESPETFIQWHYQNPERLAEIESRVLEDKIVEELLATARVDERTVSFQELLNLDTANS